MRAPPGLRLPSKWLPLGVAAALVVAVPAERARADASAADALFKAAKELMKEGKVDEACPKFEASYNEDPLLGALLNLADCREQQGKLAAAWARFGEAVEKAKKLGDSRQSFAQDRRDKLTPRLPMITIQVTNPMPKLTVYRGDQPVDPGAFGVALPVDPGETLVQVTEGDDVLWQETVKLAEGEKQEVKLDLKLIYDSAPAVKKKRQRNDEGAGGAHVVPVPFWNGQRIAGLVIGVAGVAGAGVGFGLGGVALSKKSTVDDNCTAANKSSKRYCTPAGIDASVDAQNFANASQWTLIASGAVAAIGVTLFLTAPTATVTGDVLEKRASVSPRFTYAMPIVGDGLVGATAGGTF